MPTDVYKEDENGKMRKLIGKELKDYLAATGAPQAILDKIQAEIDAEVAAAKDE